MHDANKHLSAPHAFLVATTMALIVSLAGCRSRTPAAPVDDASLTTALQSRIASDGALSTESIQSSVQAGVATLTGNVSSEAARSLAAADAAQVSGIKTVVNNLIVQAPAPPITAAAALPPQPPVPVIPKKTPILKPKPAPVPAPVVREAPAEIPATQVAVAPPPPPPQELPPAPPPPPPPPAFQNITLTPDTIIPIRITQTLDSATTQQGDTFTGTIATDIVIDNLVAIRQGTPVSGRVSAVQEAAHYKGSSLLTVELTSINRRGEKIAITTAPYSVEGKGRGKNTAEKVGGGAAVGAILGGILGGGKGAAIGAAAGGGVGAGANTITRGEQVQIPSESLIRFQLTTTLSLKVPAQNTESTSTNPDLQQRPADQPPQ
ncbi:BON domain-containing protein [Tunturiibacter lichenicola]|uniref:BON domain-containing protein n=1 Tax=Tunturiibacter lichenicola TaxID=2051959 RepID=UPI0028C3B447|nr:BON domain-containing protein [Edaphobacter lichenicola]